MTTLQTVLAAVLLSAPGLLQSPASSDPNSQIDPAAFNCSQHTEMVTADDGRAEARILWAHGYYSALTGLDESSAPIRAEEVVVFAEQLNKLCRANPRSCS
jgi:hypothetical protein